MCLHNPAQMIILNPDPGDCDCDGHDYDDEEGASLLESMRLTSESVILTSVGLLLTSFVAKISKHKAKILVSQMMMHRK